MCSPGSPKPGACRDRIGPVNPTLEDGLRAFREATEMAKSIRIELDDEYLANIARVEALPENQSGADKSWVWRMDEAFRSTARSARLLPR